MYYLFSQRNPNGEYVGPKNILIRAKSAKAANVFAELKTPIYFDGISKGVDCKCCMFDRWERVEENEGYKSLHKVSKDFNGPVLLYLEEK